jgi:hypothetical protein
METPIVNKVVEQLKDLPQELPWRVLEFARALAQSTPRGVPGREFLRFAGTVSAEDAELMRGAIERGCEQVAACIASHATPVQVGGGSTEDVCVSNADAMSQIVRPAYWLYFAFRVRQLGFAEGRDWLRQRVENNWATLIPPAQIIIEKEYHQVAEFLRL